MQDAAVYDVLNEARNIYSQTRIAEALQVDVKTIKRWEARETEPPSYLKPALQQMLFGARKHQVSNPSFRFIDLFAGIGGLRLAFERAGGECVFTSEYNDYAVKTYSANFDCSHPVTGDITKVDEKYVPDHDVLLAGFPCQPFSLAGVSKKQSLGRAHGFACEAQGTLFFDVARILKEKRPAAFMLENVKNLVSHDKGRTFQVILKTLTEELGYNVSYKVIDGGHWVPQHRERTAIVGFLHDSGFSWDNFPIPENRPVMADILHPEDGSENADGHCTLGEEAAVNPKYTLSDKLWTYLQNYAAKHKAKGNGFGYGMVKPSDRARTLSARYHKDGSEILVYQTDKNPRRLTPRECARLMGFDQKTDTTDFVIPVSDTRAYQQFGNSVIVPMFEAVAKHMHPHILASMEHSSSGLKACG